jgi:type II secretory pathway pseudopilin PulG
MLVVMVIIGILMALLLAAVQHGRVVVRNGAIQAEINQIEMSLENYRSEYGDYPPNFVDVNIVAERGSSPVHDALQADARDAIVRHLRKAFPRYVPGAQRYVDPSPFAAPNPDSRPDATPFDRFVNDIYYKYNRAIDPAAPPGATPTASFDPASALVFWLGGLPEQVPASGGQWIPAGFHSDPELPFKPGGPRTKPLFDFQAERLVLSEPHVAPCWSLGSPDVAIRFLRYYPDAVDAPYVYFRARRRGANWHYGFERDSNGAIVPYSYYHSLVGTTEPNIAVAYRDPQSPPTWREYDKFQVIAAGIDGDFGSRHPCDNGQDHLGLAGPCYRFTKTGGRFTKGDHDNLASFCERRLEDEM